ncbi:energy transducer TonB [Thalassotalea sp. HSM 43]|uniref:energy transducer TonB n=1 Tax=Thalassotalea sp. HSM 43 TaxID=2552945 RepID=UPI00107FF274|nr:energy transducer TonB [Thalassotalea sp. HSM 43]QBY05461.1 energy transducer TonB [Thalassotalea sp. HSM 43]
MKAARLGRSGWVQIRYTIDTFGFVQNPEVIESSDSIFESESLEAIKSWRFAPKFVDGKAVEAKITLQIDYTMGS